MRYLAVALLILTGCVQADTEQIDTVVYKVTDTIECAPCGPAVSDPDRYFRAALNCIQAKESTPYTSQCADANWQLREKIVVPGKEDKIQVNRVCSVNDPECITVYVRPDMDPNNPECKHSHLDWMIPRTGVYYVCALVVEATIDGELVTRRYTVDTALPWSLYPPEAKDWYPGHFCYEDPYNFLCLPPRQPCGTGVHRVADLALDGTLTDMGSLDLTLPQRGEIVPDRVELSGDHLRVSYREHAHNAQWRPLPKLTLFPLPTSAVGVGFAVVNCPALGSPCSAESISSWAQEVENLELAVRVASDPGHEFTVYFAYEIRDGVLYPVGEHLITQPECCIPPRDCESPEACK